MFIIGSIWFILSVALTFLINWSLSEKPHSIRQYLYRLQKNMQKCHCLVTLLYISKDSPVFVVTGLRMSSSGNGKVPVLGAR